VVVFGLLWGIDTAEVEKEVGLIVVLIREIDEIFLVRNV